MVLRWFTMIVKCVTTQIVFSSPGPFTTLVSKVVYASVSSNKILSVMQGFITLEITNNLIFFLQILCVNYKL